MLDKYLLRGDILEALLRKPPAKADLRIMLEEAFPADIAEILEELEPDQQIFVLGCLSAEDAAEVLGEADERIQKALLLRLISRTELTPILNEIAPDEGADLVGLLPEKHGEEALQLVDPEQADAIRNLATYDPETAGGVMTTEYVSVAPKASVGETLTVLRESLDAESISNIYVVEEDNTLVGVMSVRDILEAGPEELVSDAMVTDVVSTRADEDQEDASRLLDRYDFTSLPVVDEDRKLLGVITIDDAMDVLEEEAEEDIAMMAGSGNVSARDSALRHLKYRLPWLLVTLCGGLLAAMLLRHFEPTLHKVTELVFFMPVLVGMAGNVGIQSSAVMVRGFATGEMVMEMTVHTLLKQMCVGLMVGTLCGAITGMLAFVITGKSDIGMAVAISMTVGILCAAVAGTILPIACERLGVDPAVASGPLLTTMNDILGLFIYLAVATFILAQTL